MTNVVRGRHGEDGNIMQVYKGMLPSGRRKDHLNLPAVGPWCILESEGHSGKTLQSTVGRKGRLVTIQLLDLNPLVAAVRM